MDAVLCRQYVNILHEELVPALGCTEPIAVALAGALATRLLGCEPQNLYAACSGNIVKNVKGVVVPNSGGQKGMEIAAILGALGGDPDRKLEVLSGVRPEHVERAKELADSGFCRVELLPGSENLHIIMTARAEEHEAVVEIAESHTNVVRQEKDGVILAGGPYIPAKREDHRRDFMSVAGILEFAETSDLAWTRDVLDRQIVCNLNISEEGLHGNYGAGVGRTLLVSRGDDVRNRAKARAAAGSDARMSGCELPVVINSGSGNQGMAVSLPIIEYAREFNLSQEKLYRALLVSNLIAIHQKSGIGKLSAYCGAVSAACGSGAAITWLSGGNFKQITDTITNTLANVSGIVCDGAKPSCAAKIASALDAAIMAHDLAMSSHSFSPGEGIVQQDVEETIRSVGRLASVGMHATDEEVLKIMIGADAEQAALK
ncbi:MAG: L-serine ammonia-lyase, iron-sulfur-dependent, subunit alpha [Deltaproteobacteria bacterium]|jgi:L-cysteine desulfidase|nr:L-serine ammonia-lyase, iron-sulfur-dependent, subunit alpha [Deltaproteobacteria bacterium]